MSIKPKDPNEDNKLCEIDEYIRKNFVIKKVILIISRGLLQFKFIHKVSFTVIFSVQAKARMVSYGKRLIKKRNKSLLLKKYSMRFVMKPMLNVPFEKLCSCEHFEIIQISFNCTAYTGKIEKILGDFNEFQTKSNRLSLYYFQSKQ